MRDPQEGEQSFAQTPPNASEAGHAAQKPEAISIHDTVPSSDADRSGGSRPPLATFAIHNTVRTSYAAVARQSACGQPGVQAVAEAFGYSADELAAIPAQANLGLSCGNPTAFASLRPGEVVVDLGCGGGLDVFLASPKVGPQGKAIGIDMTPEMIELARRNAARGIEGRAFTNVEFHQAAIDRLPLADASVDCVISNCVINLAPNKPAVFREIARVLKRGGRLAASDIALKRPLPEELAGDLMAYVGCIAGAIPIDDYRRGLLEAGFSAVEVIDSGADLNAYALVEDQAACCAPAMAAPATAPADAAPSALAVIDAPGAPSQPDGVHARLAELLGRYNINDYAASVRVYAMKP